MDPALLPQLMSSWQILKYWRLWVIHSSTNLNQQYFLGDGLSAAAQFSYDEFDVWDREDHGPTTLIEKKRNSFVTGLQTYKWYYYLQW